MKEKIKIIQIKEIQTLKNVFKIKTLTWAININYKTK